MDGIGLSHVSYILLLYRISSSPRPFTIGTDAVVKLRCLNEAEELEI